MRKVLNVTLVASLASVVAVGQAAAQQVQFQGDVVTYAVPANSAAPDFVNATPMPLPQAQSTDDMRLAVLADAPQGTPGVVGGTGGSGKQSPSFLGKPVASPFSPDEFGNAPSGFGEHPFSTATADLTSSTGTRLATNTTYPYRASGKLFFTIPAGIPGFSPGSYVCSASLIKRGVIVTAAHCIAAFAQSRFYNSWVFVPGYRGGAAPYGAYSGVNAWILASYYNNAASCPGSVAPGVVCPNDIGVIELSGLPGTSTGWYGFGWDGYGFTAANLVHITQTGYPVCLESGGYMQRNDSHGFTGSATSYQSNTIIGSLMCGGSSGGPWLTTFGRRPALTGTTTGNEAQTNTVVGVTSWGYTSTSFKQQGASRFRATNIVTLVNAACGGSILGGVPPTDPRCL